MEKLKLTGDEAIGAAIIRQAAFAPATAIANNCGKQGNLIAEKIYEGKGNFGYNGLTDEFTDLIKAGVIDPVLVTNSALINAASVAGLLLTTAAMITDKPKPKSSNLQCMAAWVVWAAWVAWVAWAEWVVWAEWAWT